MTKQPRNYYLYVNLPSGRTLKIGPDFLDKKSDEEARETLEAWDFYLHSYPKKENLLLSIFEANEIPLDLYPADECEIYLTTKKQYAAKLPVLYSWMPQPMGYNGVFDKLQSPKINKEARMYGECAKLWDGGYRKRSARTENLESAYYLQNADFPEKIASSYRLRRDLTITLDAIKRGDRNYLDYIRFNCMLSMLERHSLERQEPLLVTKAINSNTCLAKLKQELEVAKMLFDARAFEYEDQNPEYRDELNPYLDPYSDMKR